jgi:hypothetical protein
VVTVTARDYAFEMPDTVVAGRTEIQLVNKGPELHHAALLRLDAGKTAADLFAALKAGGPPPKWVHEVGGPNAPAPGRTSAAVVDLAPARTRSSASSRAPTARRTWPKGMARPFTVVAEPRVRAGRQRRGAAAAPRPWSSAPPT